MSSLAQGWYQKVTTHTLLPVVRDIAENQPYFLALEALACWKDKGGGEVTPILNEKGPLPDLVTFRPGSVQVCLTVEVRASVFCFRRTS